MLCQPLNTKPGGTWVHFLCELTQQGKEINKVGRFYAGFQITNVPSHQREENEREKKKRIKGNVWVSM